MKNEKKKQKENLRLLRSYSLCACMIFLGGIAFPMPSNASNATELATQQKGKQITGTITDSRGVPVIGATVLEVGTTNAAITDLDGHFTLNARPGVKLKISYIGFKDILVTVGSTNEYNIELKEDTEAIEEIVVVGYGTQKKVNLTGAIATISSDKLVNRTSANVTNMLAGQMPGVTVIQNSGQPGADGGLLRVRGLGTMGNASAMVVIDGVESTMSSVDPNDIENISILKDAAASAIYGVRAANGVILITTKKGSRGRAIVSYDGYVGWQSATRMPKFLDSYDYATLMNEAYRNDGLNEPYSQEALKKFKDGSDPDHYANSDWLGTLLSENGLFHNHHLSIKGGSNKITYSLAINYHDKDGLIENTNYNKFNII